MKRAKYLILILLLVGCAKHKLIPTEELEQIITETVISDAIMNHEQQKIAAYYKTEIDSLDIYAPILKRYGYTIQDFQYTIGVYVLRKSNPLDNIFSNVSKEIEFQDGIIKERYNYLLKFDTLARNHYADTIFVKDTTLKGELKQYQIELTPGKLGSYKITFDYLVSEDPNIGSKSIRLNASSRNKNVRRLSYSYWMINRAGEQKFDNEYKLTEARDSLIISFQENYIDKKKKTKDTSEVSNIMIVYYPPKTKAIKDYLHLKTGLNISLEEYYEQKFATYLDSIIIPFDFRQAPAEKWIDTIRSEWKDTKRRNRGRRP